MSNISEIKTKIKSVTSTQKITRAMEMVAASKMKKAQEKVLSSRPYSEKIKNVISHVSRANTEYEHEYLIKRDVKRIGIIVVSSDRGLCGGLNSNLFKTVLKKMQEYDSKGVHIDICTMGRTGESFFIRNGANVVGSVNDLSDHNISGDLVGITKVMLDSYSEKKIDKLYLAHNTFVNTMSQVPTFTKLLPISKDEVSESERHWDYIYEPSAQVLLEKLLERYISSLFYQGVVENLACEQAARMVAMKSASDNAGELIDGLKLNYNKARQAAITQELSEIVAGAAAV